MKLTTLIAELDRLDIELKVLNDQIHFRPASLLSKDLVEGLRSHKPRLVELLNSKSPEWCDRNDRIDETLKPGPISVNSVTPSSGLSKPHSASDRQSPELPPPCRCHGHQRWWFSRSGKHWVCGHCHPPVRPDLAVRWIDAE